jgi:rubredoxin
MSHRARIDPFTKLIWTEGQNFAGWGCAKCGWVFNPAGPAVGNSIDEMKEHFRTQLSQKFASHSCPDHPRGKAANTGST